MFMLYEALRDILEIRNAKRVINNALQSEDTACIAEDLNRAKDILDSQENRISKAANEYYNKYYGNLHK